MSRIQRHTTLFAIMVILTFLVMYAQGMLIGGGVAVSTLVAGGFAGITLILGVLALAIQHHRHQAAFQQKQKAGDQTDVHQARTVEIDVVFEMAFDMAMDALQELDGIDIPQSKVFIRSKQRLKIHTEDRDTGRIEAGLRAKTIGIQDVTDFSKVTIQLQRLDTQTTRLHIESKPANPLEVYDMGRHMHYVNQLALTLRKASQQANATSRLGEAHQSDELSGDNLDTQSNSQEQHH